MTGREIITVGQLVQDLRRFETDCPDYDVVCFTPDEMVCHVVGMGLDDEGVLSLVMEEEYGDAVDFYDVEMLLEGLDGYGNDAKVHLDAYGQALGFEMETDGSVFALDDSEDMVYCNAIQER